MAATMSITRPTSTTTMKQNLLCAPYARSTTTAANNNNNNTNSSSVYSYADEEVLITKGLDDSDCFGASESLSRPIKLPPGYISISSFTRRRLSTDSEELVASTKYESDFWPPSFNVFSKRRRKISYAEEALPDERDTEESKEESPSLRISEFIPSFPTISFPKLPERPWFCNSCKKPKDECNCLCVIS